MLSAGALREPSLMQHWLRSRPGFDTRSATAQHLRYDDRDNPSDGPNQTNALVPVLEPSRPAPRGLRDNLRWQVVEPARPAGVDPVGRGSNRPSAAGHPPAGPERWVGAAEQFVPLQWGAELGGLARLGGLAADRSR